MKVKLYTYPAYTSLSPPGTDAFRKQCTDLLRGVTTETTVTPSIVPKQQQLSERQKLCDEVTKIKSSSNEFDPMNPTPYKLSFYQRAVTTLVHPQRRCRRLLVVSSMGSGKSLMIFTIVANFANLSLYPNPKNIDVHNRRAFCGVSFHRKSKPKPTKNDVLKVLSAPYCPPLHGNKDAVQTFLSKHPGVPSKIVLVVMKSSLVPQVYSDVTTCGAIYHEYFQRSFPSLVKDLPKTNTRRAFGEAWLKKFNVEVVTFIGLSNDIKNNNTTYLFNALVLIDEVHCVFSPGDVTSTYYKDYIPRVLDLTKEVQLYGLVCFTGTPIVNNFTNLVDLDRLMTTNDPYLDHSALSATEFVKQHVTQTKVDVKLLTSVEAATKACKIANTYKYRNTLNASSTAYLQRVFSAMRSYVYVYDAVHDKVRMAEKNTQVIFTHDVMSVSDSSDTDILIDTNNLDKRFVNWAVKSVYKTEGQRFYTKRVNGLDVKSIPSKYLRNSLVSTMLVDVGHNVKLNSYLQSKFPLRVLQNNKVFVNTLFDESPVFYQLFRKLCKRVGKALVYANVPSKNGSEVFCNLLARYIIANRRDNIVLKVPDTVSDSGLAEYVDNHIMYNIDTGSATDFHRSSNGEVSYSKRHDRIMKVFQASTEVGLESPIFFFSSQLNTGFSVNGGVRELHVLTPASVQVEGRGHRMLAHCGHENKYDVYKYFNMGLGLFPNHATVSCDLVHHRLVQESQVDVLVEYAEDLLRRSSLSCSLFDQLFGVKSNCGLFRQG